MNQPPDRRKQFDGLTGLRWLCALHVVFFHYARSHFADVPILNNFIYNGYTAVSFFFVLSGAMLAYNYVKPNGELKKTKTDFWMARIIRIYPVYLLTWFFAWLVLLIQIAQAEQSLTLSHIKQSVFFLSLLQAWHPQLALVWVVPAWSLSAEAAFYAVFPFAAYQLAKIKSTKSASITAVLLFLACMTAPTIYYLYSRDLVYVDPLSISDSVMKVAKFNPLVRLGEFLFGILMGLILQKIQDNKRWNEIAPYACLGAGFLYVVGHCFHPGPFYIYFHNGLFAPLTGVIILASASGRSLQFFSSPVVVLLGKASFALYLLQAPLNNMFTILGYEVVAIRGNFFIYLISLNVISVLVFKLYEDPIKTLLTRVWRTHSSGL